MNPSTRNTSTEQETQLSVDTSPSDCSAETQAIPADVPQALINQQRYEIVRELGKGGMGKVYLAKHATMDRIVAIKVIRPELLGDDQAMQRFRSEILATSKLSHPNVVTAYDAEANTNNGSCFLVTEYVDGCDLAEFTARQSGRIPFGQACDIIFQAAQGLQHALDHGLVHRDIKPHNILIDSKGTAKVADFGLALIHDSDAVAHTHSGTIHGSVDYMAPEQASNSHAADTRSDIYALGCTLFQLLLGKPPFAGGSVVSKLQRHATEPRPSCAGNDIPPELDNVVKRMMDRDPGQRYQEPRQVAEALAPFRTPMLQFTPNRPNSPTYKYVAAAALPLFLLAAWIVTIATDKGNIVIESQVDDVSIAVKQGGKTIELVDVSNGSRVRLRSGTYELELKSETNAVHVSPNSLQILRGKTKVVTISRESTPNRRMPEDGLPVHKSELSSQIIGWYDGGRGRRLTILPEQGKLIAVIDWGNAAPCSVGEIRTDGESTFFWQPNDKVTLEITRTSDKSTIASIRFPHDVNFSKELGLSELIGQFANSKNQIMTISDEDGELHCSIDWGANAPLTNGHLRVAASGDTVLQGYKWQDQMKMETVENSLRAIELIGLRFARIPEDAEPSDAPESASLGDSTMETQPRRPGDR